MLSVLCIHDEKTRKLIGDPMNKADIITAIAGEMGVTKVAAQKVVEIVLEQMSSALVAGDRVSLMGFGSLKPVNRVARTYTDVQSGKKEQADAYKTITFNPSTELKALINK